MSDSPTLTTALIEAVERLAERFRALPQSALERGAAAEGRALAQELAARAQRIEFPGAAPAPLPDVGIFAVGDQLAVAGGDLVVALATVRSAEAAQAERCAADRQAELAEAVRLVEEAASRVR